MGRLKLRDKHGELRPEVEYWNNMELDEWIADRIPMPPPVGTTCEHPDHPRWAEHDYAPVGDLDVIDSYYWQIVDGHVCYHYVCQPCGEQYEDGADPGEYPTTGGGYAVAPKHCTT